MSDSNENKVEPAKRIPKPQQSKPSQKKRGTSTIRKPSKKTAPGDQQNVSETSNASSSTSNPDTSGQGDHKQPARRPAKKKSDPSQDRSDHAKSEEKSGPALTDKNQSSAQGANSNEREQSRRRSANRTGNSNRRRSNSSSRSSSRGGRSKHSKPTLRQPAVNPEELQAKAWQLYSSDINEESTAMFNEEEAIDLVRRSFILADIFLRFRDQLFDPKPLEQENLPDSPANESAE